MQTLGERVSSRREELGISVQAVAAAAGVSVQSVYLWQRGEVVNLKAANLLAVAELLKVRPKWLQTGKGLKELSNTATGPEIKGRVPIISWVQAGTFSSVVDNFQPGDADEWAETTVPIHQHTYALRVRGDSMTNPNGEPTFPDGQVIVVEPDAIDSPEKLVGSLVIVRRDGDEEATFKKLVRDAGRLYLRPLNPQYPMIELREGDVFCGVVREKVTRFF